MATLKNETTFEDMTIKYLFLWERGVISATTALRGIRASLDIEKISRAIHKGVAI